MPSVASEAHPILPHRPHSPSARSHPEPDAREAATPFVELLDSPAPAERPPAPRQALSERPERNAPPKPKDDGAADAKPVQDSAPERPEAKASEATLGNDAKSAKDTTDAATADTSTTRDGDAASSADAQSKTDTDTLTALTLAVTAPPAMVVAVAQPLAPVGATTRTPEAEALTVLPRQAAGGVAPNAAPKPGPAQGDRAADASAKTGVPADPQAGVPQIDSAKDGQARGNGHQAGGEFHRAAADILSKPEVSAPVQQGGDAGTAVKASADALQHLALAASTHSTNANGTASAPAPSQAQAQAQPAAVPLSGLAVAITTQAHGGNKHFEIRLDPPELGRIDVKLDVDRDGNVSTRLVVDRADTLDLLKRDASALERALQQSGLKTSDNALEFSLRQQGFARDDTAAPTGVQLILPDDDPAPIEAMRQGYGRLLGLGGGLDIRV